MRRCRGRQQQRGRPREPAGRRKGSVLRRTPMASPSRPSRRMVWVACFSFEVSSSSLPCAAFVCDARRASASASQSTAGAGLALAFLARSAAGPVRRPSAGRAEGGWARGAAGAALHEACVCDWRRPGQAACRQKTPDFMEEMTSSCTVPRRAKTQARRSWVYGGHEEVAAAGKRASCASNGRVPLLGVWVCLPTETSPRSGRAGRHTPIPGTDNTHAT